MSETERADLLRQELAAVLTGPAFQGSHRAQEFLRHIVERTLGNNLELLNERSIGTELFGRPPAYDTSADAVVRVTAKDVRRRLAEHYTAARGTCPAKIALPNRSYVATFCFNDLHPEPSPAAPARKSMRLKPIWWPAGITAAAAGALLFITLGARSSPIVQFWQPVLDSPAPAVFCLGNAPVYRLSGEAIQAHFREYPEDMVSGSRLFQLRPGERFGAADLVPVPEMYTHVALVFALSRVGALLSSYGKTYTVRNSSEVSFRELRAQPAILLGAFSNRWTLPLTSELRFKLDDRVHGIVDRQSPGRVWSAEGPIRQSEDFALISRVTDSKTGQVFVCLAGIKSYGSRAAAELVTDSKFLSE